MRKVLATTIILCGLCSSAFAEEAITTPAQPPKANRFGLDFTLSDGGTAYGIIYERDVTVSDRIFLQIETFKYDNSRETPTRDYLQVDKTTLKGEEFELGYMRRVSDTGQRFGFYIGPSVAIQIDDGKYDGTRYYRYGTTVANGNTEYDLGINLYANIMTDYTFINNMGIFAMFSYGYQFERDGKTKYTTGDRSTLEFTTDSDTFWNVALGVLYAF